MKGKVFQMGKGPGGNAATGQANVLDPDALGTAVRCEQIRILYQSPAILAINAVNALLVAFILQSIYSFWIVAAWILLFFIVIPLRILDCRLYHRKPQSAETAGRWGQRFVVGAAVTGCLWGLAGSAILLTPDRAYQAFTAFVLGGMVAGAILTDSAYLPALIAFVAPAILPATLAFLSRPDPMSMIMGLLLAAFTAALGTIGFRANEWITSNARRGIIQAALMADLEKEVADRKAAESELERSNEILKAVATSATEILRSHDFDRSVPKVLQLIGQLMGVSRVQLYERDDDAEGDVMRVARHAWSASEKPATLDAQFPALPLLLEGKAQVFITRETEGSVNRLLTSRSVQSCLMAPVVIEGKWWGAVAAELCDEERTWSAAEVDTIRTLAEFIGAAISQVRSQKEMERLTNTDVLTGLPNRTSFMQGLSKAFDQAKRATSPLAVFYLDLDRFKDINETLGHSKGDELLIAVAERLNSGLRDVDLFARVGGDEFAIFLSAGGDPVNAKALAMRLNTSMAVPYVIGAAEIQITVSIGISVFRAAMTTPEDLMRQADLAVYEAKEAGRNQCRFHSEALDLAVRERVALTEGLRKALDRGEFQVYYQPQVEVPSGVIIGVEALVRWIHPKRGLIPPDLFIPIAEKSGIIVPIGRWILAEVCRQVRIWRTEGINPPLIGINLSAVQLLIPTEFERDLTQVLAAEGIDPRTIELELTETVLMDTTRSQISTIERLQALGIQIAIDDFGTGYSSLEYLRAYRVSRIKIAQQFVSRLPGDPGSAAIVRAIIGLAREFGIEVIAEGVENASQLEFLVSCGCRYVQGYYFCRPAPAEQASIALRRGVLTPEAEER
jgi:diguanylate cyclase (GGDEF)-like protein